MPDKTAREEKPGARKQRGSRSTKSLPTCRRTRRHADQHTHTHTHTRTLAQTQADKTQAHKQRHRDAQIYGEACGETCGETRRETRRETHMHARARLRVRLRVAQARLRGRGCGRACARACHTRLCASASVSVSFSVCRSLCLSRCVFLCVCPCLLQVFSTAVCSDMTRMDVLSTRSLGHEPNQGAMRHQAEQSSRLATPASTQAKVWEPNGFHCAAQPSSSGLEFTTSNWISPAKEIPSKRQEKIVKHQQ